MRGPPLARPLLLFEISVPGLFACGDVRHRSLKPVASAVALGPATPWDQRPGERL